MYSYMELTGRISETGQMRSFVLALTLIAWLFYLPLFRTKDTLLWVSIVVFGVCFYGTSLFQTSSNSMYNSHFLRWASTCLSFVALGLCLSRVPEHVVSKIISIIPLFTGILTVVISNWAINGISVNSQYTTDSGFTYQSISYYMALFFGLNSCYLLTSFKKKTSNRVVAIYTIVIMIINTLVCLMSGGRGGAILLIVYFILFIRELSTFRKVNRLTTIVGFIFAVCVFLLVSDEFNLTETAGFSRTFSYLESDNRTELWRDCASRISEAPIFGHGLGSDFFIFGYYTHNIIIDFLVETGIVGTIILLFVFTKVITILFKEYRNNNIYLLPILLSVYAIVLNSFSAYWVSTQYHWLALGFVSSSLFSFQSYKK